MAPDDPLDPGECRACRGSGKVTSNLGGEPSQVVCPWCDGTGRFIPEHDAQARWGDAAPAEDAPAPAEDAPEASLDT